MEELEFGKNGNLKNGKLENFGKNGKLKNGKHGRLKHWKMEQLKISTTKK